MKKKKKKEEQVEETAVYDEQSAGYYNGGYNNGYFSPDAYNSAYYGGQYVEPLDASEFNAQANDPNVIMVVPGRDGVPYNITSKGIENLTRIERLRRNGVISDTNYAIMKQKIINMFIQ